MFEAADSRSTVLQYGVQSFRCADDGFEYGL